MAEIIYADPVTEDILINESDEIAGGEEAECECCCDCETGGPSASFTSVQSSADPDGNACCVQYTDTSSAGACGEIVSWLWDFGDENSSTSQNPEHCYTGSGPWTVRLTVTDSSGCTDFMETSVACLCNCATDAPVANFSYLQTCDDPCCFNFYDESTPDEVCGAIVSWLWDFGDGSTSTSQNPTHCYDAEDAGPWDVTLTITDEMGCTDAAVMEVTCETLVYCSCVGDGSFIAPDEIELSISGWSGTGACAAGACAALNGTFTLTHVGSLCTWRSPTFTEPACMDTFGTTMYYELQVSPNDTWKLYLVSSGLPYYFWNESGLDCEELSGEHTLTESGGAADNGCGSPVGISPVITVPDLTQNGCP